MVGKNNQYLKNKKEGTKVESYSIKKFKVGTASVVIGASIFFGAGAVAQASEEVSNNTTSDNTTNPNASEGVAATPVATAQPVAKETTKEDVANAVAAKLGGETAKEVKALDKTKLENYIAEIEAKLANGTYDSKTEESVAVLKADLEAAKTTLANATTQDELTKAYSKLVTTANTKLKAKPVEKKETPEVDTTNGQPTVGKKAENTEKKSESNSIENTGSHDSRNGKALDKDNVLRTEATDTEKPTAEIPFSNGKDVYVYGAESTGFDIKIKDNSGFIASATVKRGGNQDFTAVTGEPGKLNAQYGYTVNEFTTKTEASESNPAVIHYTGVPGGELNAEQLEKAKTTGLTLGWRFVTATDEAGNFIENKAAGAAVNTDPGSFNVIVKPQTYKYQPKNLTNADKVLVANPNQLTATELEAVKNSLKVIYSTTSEDARFEKLKGSDVADTYSVVDTIVEEGKNFVVTYKDGSKDTVSKGLLVKSGEAPAVDTNPKARGTVLSTDEKLSGTGVVGATVKVTVRNPEKTEVLLEKTATVNAEGKWEIKLDAGLNSNEALLGARENARTFYKNKPKNPVEIVQTVDGIESKAKEQDVSIGPSVILPSAAAKDGKSVVAGAKEVTFTVPHDAGFTYFFYTNKETNKEVQLDIKREDDGSLVMAGGNASKATVKNTVKGPFYDTVTLTLTEPVKEGVDLKVIPHNGGATKGTYLGKTPYPVTNEAPVVAPVVENQNEKTVPTETTITKADLLALVKVTDYEDDQDATLGDKAHVRVVSVDGNTNVTGIDTSEAGEHTIIYKAVDSQGKESAEYTYKVIVRKNDAPEVKIPYSVDGKKDVYVYANEDFDIPIKYTDDNGRIVEASIRQGGNKELPQKTGQDDPNVLDNQYTMTVGKISKDTEATENNPATIHITGNLSKTTPGLTASSFPTDENGEYPIVTRYATATDADGKNIYNNATGSSYSTDPGGFRIVLKAQTAKYDVKELDDANKTVVSNTAALTPEDLATVKENLQLEYSKKNKDKNINKDEAVTPENVKKAVDKVEQKGENLVVTYKDGSKDTIPVDKVAKLDKQPAIDAVTNKANEQIAAINGNDNLTQAEKDAAIAKVNEGKQAALDKIDEATNNDAVTAAKDEGTGAVAKVNPVAKEKAKQAIADELKAKNNELDARKDLSDAEKAEAKKEAKKLADAQLAEIAKQPDNKETAAEAAEAQKAVDAAKKTGVDEVAAVNPIAKENALKAVADELAKKEKEIDARTDLTKEEKDAAKEKAKELAEKAKNDINAQPNTAATPEAAKTAQDAVNAAKKKGVDEVAAVNPPAEKKTAAKATVASDAEAKKQAIQGDNTLSEAAKEKLKKEVDDIKEATDAAITGAKKNADVDKAKKAGETAIAAINSARVPGNKLVAEDPTNLKPEEQEKLKKAIEAVNPGATVTVNPNGSASVILPNGKTVPLEQADLTKSADALNNPAGGNNINRPVDKVIVKDKNPKNFTPEEKAKIKQAVRDVNPNAVVTMDDNGTVTVSTPEGNTAAFPASELVRTLEDAAKPDSGNAGVRKPADKVVGDATNPADQVKATEKLKKLNGGDDKVKAIKYDDEGNATVVLKDGTIATIPASDLFKTPEEAKKANGGDDINKPNSQTVVADKNALTEPEREAIKAKIAAVNPEGSVITVNEKGEATVTTPEGKTAVIDADDLIKGVDEKTNPKAGNNINNPADRVQVADKANLKPEEIAKIKAAVEAVNPGATVVVDEKGNATVTTPAAPGVEQKTATIPVSELVKTPADKDNVTGGNQVNTPADRVVVENPTALTEDDKKAIKAKIQAVNPGADVVFDANGNATVTTPAAPGEQPKTATIPAADLVKAKADLADPTKQDAVNKPADKVVVDPALVDNSDATLPQTAKDAIKAAVEAVNPGSTVVVDDKGNATVTTKDGKTVVIPKADLVKKESDKETAKAGNNINKPADKVVANKDALTPEDIKAIKAKVEAVNPGATVVVDAKGNATVVTPDGQTATIPASDLVKSPEEAKDAKAGNNVNKPADKVAADKDNLQPADKEKIKEAILKVNPDAKVFVDNQGNATVTTKDGKTATIPVEDLVKDPAAKETPNAGNKVNTPATKVVVTSPDNKATDEEKIKAEILKVNPGATVAFDTEGNATVTTKDGAVATIPAADLAKDAADLTKPDKQDEVNKPADKTVVKKAGKLTQAEKDAIKAEIAKVNRDPQTTIVVDNEGNATVTTPEGKTVVIAKEDLVKSPQEVDGAKAGNNINKPADKVAAAAADLVGPKKDEVVAKIKAAVESVNPGATVFVDDKGNATVTTPDGKTATIPVEDLLKDPAAKDTPSAGNKVNTPAERTVVANPAKLTDAEKAKITAAIQAVNPEGTKVVFDEAGNATVTVPNEDGTTSSTATIPVSDLVKSNAEKDLLDPAKQNPVKKPIDQTVVADKDALTPDDIKAIKAKVQEVNPDATVVVDAKGNATVTTKDGKTAVIAADDLVKTDDEVLSDPKAGNVINKPADGVFVKDGQITDDVKAKIAAKVQRVNPGSTVFVDENGNATVTTPEGKTATIPVADLTKTDADKAKVNAGNKINSPADRVLVKDRDKLTAEDIQEIEKNILEVNPGATVVFDAKGNATVKNANGDIATIPVEALAKPKADLLKPEKQDLIKKPVDKVLVTDPANLDKEAIKKAVEEVNPGSTVVVDDKGNATVTTEDGRSFVIPAKDLVKTAEEAKNAKAGNNINKPADKVAVADPTKPLSQEEKKAIEAKIKEVNPDAKAIFVDDKGNATVTIEDKDGNTETATIPAKDLVTSQEEAKQPNAGNNINTPADKVVVKDPDHLSEEDKAKITEAIKAVNPEANVVFDDKGNATVTTKDGEVATIPAADLVKSKEEAAKPNAGNNINTPADKVAVDSSKPLTQEEKDVIAAKVAEVNPGATIAVDDKGNATVTTTDGKTAVIPAAALTKTADSAKEPNAGNDVVKPADKTVVANPDSLTQEEKDAIAAKVAEVNPEAKTVVVDDKGNATVTVNGKAVVIPAKDLVKTAEEAAKPNAGNDVNTPADKTVVANPNALTPEEKKAIEDKVKAVNPGAEVVVDNKGNATVTKDGKVAVIPAADLTKTADSAKEPNAGNDVVKPADKTVVANPESLTQEEKDAIVAKVKAVNPDATVVVDDKGNATVTPKDGKPVVIPASDLTKSKEDATKPNAGNDIVKPADKTVVANKDALTPEEKKAIEDKVKAVNPGAEVVVDDKGNATVTKDGKVAVIPATDLVKSPEDATKPNAGNDVSTPADKTVVANPNALTPEEKKAIEDKVKAVNPGSTVVVDDKGNATVTTPEGKTAVIPATDLTKSKEDAAKPNAGNDVVKPADKTAVKDPAKLTDEEKQAITDKLTALNPDAKVVVDDKGNATVTPKDGKPVVIPASDLTKTEAQAKEPNAGNDVSTPADKTVVANPESLTKDEKDAIAAKVKAVNPGAEVVVDDKGNATVTLPNGKTAVIPATDLTKSAAQAKEPNAGNNVAKPADKTVVANKDALTPEEKKAIEDKVKAVNPGATVVVDDKGNATVTVNGKTAVIPASDLTKSKEDAAKPNAGNDIVKPADKTVVTNPDSLTQDEKEAIAAKVKAVNPGAEVVVDDKGNATVTVNGKTAVIPAADLTKTAEDAAKPKAGNDIVKPASKTKVANPDSLTPEEKKAIADKVAAVNPGATVVVDDKGNATVTLPNGNTAVIPASDLTKSAKDVNDGKAKDNAVTPAAKTKVANPEKLTDAEKKAIEDKVKALNPGATVVVDDKGNATVVKDGNVSVIPSTDLVKVEDDAKKENGGNGANTPAAKTVVANPAKLTDEEKGKVKKAVEAVNPGAIVVVDDEGNATVTKADGTVLSIPASDLVISATKLADEAKNAKVKTPATRTLVGDKDKLTDEEKAAVKKAIEAVNPGATVVVDDKGNATVTSPDGSTATISKDQLVKNAEEAKAENDGNNINLNFEKQEVADLTNLTDAEKAAAKAKILAANPNAADVIFDAKGNATVVLKDGKAYTILAKDIFSQKGEVAPSERNNGAADVGADTNAADSDAQGVNAKLGQRLANTGTTETNTGLAGLGLAVLGGLLAAARRRKEK